MKLWLLSVIASLLGMQLTFTVRRKSADTKRDTAKGKALFTSTSASEARQAFDHHRKGVAHGNHTISLVLEGVAAEAEVAGTAQPRKQRKAVGGVQQELPGTSEDRPADPMPIGAQAPVGTATAEGRGVPREDDRGEAPADSLARHAGLMD